ncbi:MAG: metallophosphoesterase, partial [Deltaproteobacteria bacterium]|nr:metallophosphoesterase [Deltaproteobacteria bacterium]
QSLTKLHAPMGVYFVTGNHEYYFKASEWVSHLSQLGIEVLDNRAVHIGDDANPLLLAGVNDYQASHMPGEAPLDLNKALRHRRPEQEVILLCHQPKIVADAAAADVGLILSGHTHGGQIWPFNYLVKLQQPYLKGLINYNSRTTLYINQGTGYWGPPLRLGTECEITLFTLYRTKD